MCLIKNYYLTKITREKNLTLIQLNLLSKEKHSVSLCTFFYLNYTFCLQIRRKKLPSSHQDVFLFYQHF